MGIIFCLMGKSASGKDTIYKRVIACEELGLHEIVSYTTRPIRIKEVDGREYHFTDEEGYEKLKSEGRVIETRIYNTAAGPWRYFTVDDGNIKEDENYLIIGTLEQYHGLREYFGKGRVIPVYVELDDGERLQRALKRERKQERPNYRELCRRFLADDEDFSDANLEREGVKRRFRNENDSLDGCVYEISDYIKGIVDSARG